MKSLRQYRTWSDCTESQDGLARYWQQNFSIITSSAITDKKHKLATGMGIVKNNVDCGNLYNFNSQSFLCKVKQFLC